MEQACLIERGTAMTARPHFLRGYTDEWANTQPAVTPLPEPAQEDTGMLLHLHRITTIQQAEAANDSIESDIEDELGAVSALELLAISFGIVFGIAASVVQPWTWF
jgi:hypothetical protein